MQRSPRRLYSITTTLLIVFFSIGSIRPSKSKSEKDLIFAVKSHNFENVKKLINAGVDVDTSTQINDSSPLTLACVRGLKDIASFLLDKDAKNLFVALESAIKYNHIDIVKLLLEHPNGIKDLSIKGPELITQALNQLYGLPILRLLLKHGARPFPSALFELLKMLLSGKHTSKNALKIGAVLAKILIDYGADPTIIQQGNSLLHLLAGIGHSGSEGSFLFELTIEGYPYSLAPLAHVLIDAVNRIGKDKEKTYKEHVHKIIDDIVGQPNRQAIKLSFSNIVSEFLAEEGHIDIKNADGDTPLMIAAREGNEFLCKLFIQGGANPMLEAAEGTKALDLFKGPKEALERLKNFKRGEKIEGDPGFHMEENEDIAPDEPQPDHPLTGNNPGITSPRNNYWMLITIGTVITAAYAWRKHQERKHFNRIFQRLVELEEQKNDPETSMSNATYIAYKNVLLKPYKNNPAMLKKLEAKAKALTTQHLTHITGEA